MVFICKNQSSYWWDFGPPHCHLIHIYATSVTYMAMDRLLKETRKLWKKVCLFQLYVGGIVFKIGLPENINCIQVQRTIFPSANHIEESFPKQKILNNFVRQHKSWIFFSISKFNFFYINRSHLQVGKKMIFKNLVSKFRKC